MLNYFPQQLLLYISEFKLALIVASLSMRLVVSDERLDAKVFSDVVALVDSEARFALIESSALERLVISVASPAEFPDEAAST